MAGVVLEWGRAAFIVLMVGFPGVGHADDRVAATDLRVERHPTQAGTYMGIMRIKNIGSTAWSNIAYQFVDNGQPIVFQIEGRSTTTPTDVRTVPPQQEITVGQSFPLSYGTHTIVGIADPGFTLGEQGAERYNNALSRTVEVSPQLIPGVITIKVSLVEVESISFEPPQPAAGQKGTVKMRIKNLSTGTLTNVAWRIWTRQRVTWGSPPPSVVLRSEALNVGPGSVEVTAPWSPWQIGTYDVVGEVDPQNTLRETEPERANNRKQRTVSVASAARAPTEPASPAPPPPSQCPKCPKFPDVCFRCVNDNDCWFGYFCCDKICVRK